MKRNIVLALMPILFVSCTTTQTVTKTLGEQYPGMYEERPLTIAIMPPINQTNHAEAKDYFYTTLYLPLCEKGYYVYSPYLTMEMFQQESAYDSEMFIESDLTSFREVLGADAAMFTIIKEWERDHIGGMLTVNVEYILRSTKTGRTLYTRAGQISVDTKISSGSGGFGVLVDLIATAINTAATDKVIAGRKCNTFVLSDLPAGKYSSLYENDTSKSAGEEFITATVK